MFPIGVADRLCAYARSVGHFPTALKEFKVGIVKIFSTTYLFCELQNVRNDQHNG